MAGEFGMDLGDIKRATLGVASARF